MKFPLRAAVAVVVAALFAASYAIDDPRMRALIGVPTLIAVAFLFSRDIRAINRRVVIAGILMQLSLAVLILKVDRVRNGFEFAGNVITKGVEYSKAGSWIFGPLASDKAMDGAFGAKTGIPFLITLTCTVIFVASLFSVLYHLRILQAVVWVFAKWMVLLMGKKGVSGAESLSAAANVFMGQTEAPLIVKPYVARMTQSELLAIMIGGMATIAGGVMAIYIDIMNKAGIPNAAMSILATSVMAAPCGLYISKILYPETEEPETRGDVTISNEKPHANVIDAAAAGASDGMMLAINIVAMLIAFLALIALANACIGYFNASWSLEAFFSYAFAPVAHILGVDTADVPKVAQLLGVKLVGNEFLAFDQMTRLFKPGTEAGMSTRSYAIATYALTGFANISSIGIQIGGIGAMAKERRGDLARLGFRALLGGFLATLVNAAVAGVLMP